MACPVLQECDAAARPALPHPFPVSRMVDALKQVMTESELALLIDSYSPASRCQGSLQCDLSALRSRARAIFSQLRSREPADR